MTLARLTARLLSLGLAASVQAAPLYPGNEEFDTDDRAQMDALRRHCARLGRESGRSAAGAEGQPQQEGGSRTGDATSATGGEFAGGIAADQLASGEEDGGSRGDAARDLSGISARLCGEAGLIY